MNKLIPLLFLLLFSIDVYSASYTWTGTTSTDWNTNTNWSPNGIPGSSDNITISSGSGNQPLLHTSLSITNITVSAGNLNLNGYTLTVTGTTSLTGGIIRNGNLTINNSSASVGGTNIKAALNITAGAVTIANSTLDSIVSVNKTAGWYEIWNNNTFNKDLNLDIDYAGVTLTQNSNSTFNGNVNIVTGTVTFSGGTGTCTFASGKKIVVDTAAYAGVLTVNKVMQSDNITQTINIPSTATLNIRNCTWVCPTDFSSGTLEISGCTFDTIVKTKVKGGWSNQWDNNTFNDTLTFINAATGGAAVTLTTDNNTYFNDHLVISGVSGCNTQFSSNSTGSIIFASTKKINIGSGGYNGTLRLIKVIQSDTITQTITLGSSQTLIVANCSWGCPINFTSGYVECSSNTFSSSATFNKNGGWHDTWNANTFNGKTKIKNSSSGPTLVLNNNGTTNFNDDVEIEGNSPIYIQNTGTGTTNLASGKTLTIGSGGFTNTLYLKGFVQSGSTAQSITTGSGSTIDIGSNTTFNGALTLTAPNLVSSNATYNSKVTFVKTGTGNNSWGGGNTFNDSLVIKMQAAGTITLFTSGNDAYNGHISVHNTGSGNIVFGGSGSGTLASGKTITVGSGGYAGGNLTFARFTQSGTTPQNITLPSGTVNFSTGSTWNGAVTASAPIYSINGSTFNKKFSCTSTSNNVVGGSGGNTFNDTLELSMSAGVCYMSTYSTDYFNGDIILTSTGTSYGYGFGYGSTGAGILASGKKILVGSAGFTSGYVSLQRFTQNGTTAQSLTLTGTASVEFGPLSVFNAAFTADAPNIYFNGSTFHSTVTTTKTSATPNVSTGGNTFNDIVSITNTGGANMSLANTANDVYNSDVTFERTSTGDIIVSVDGNSTFKGDVSFISSSAATFGSGTGRIYFSGTASQTLSKTGSGAVNITRMTMDKSSNHLTLNVAVNIGNNLTLTSGNVITTSTYILGFNDNATVSSASNSSYVDGPVNKTGNDAFTFPTGKGGYYRPIGISAPATSAVYFKAEYINTGQALGSSADTSIYNLSNCEYWTLTRNMLAATTPPTPTVTLSWNSATCNNATPANMRVASWSSSQWNNLGNGGYTGNVSGGTVYNSTTVSAYNTFALSTMRCTATASISGSLAVCGAASTTTLTASSGLRYKWSSGPTTQSITTGTPGTYSVIVYDSLGCVGYDTVTVVSGTPPTASVVTDTIYAGLGNTISIGGAPTGSGGLAPYTYSWSPSTGLSSTTVSNPDLTTSVSSQLYTVTVTDSIGCTDQATVLVYAATSGRVGLSVETSGCPGSTMTICITNPEVLGGMEIRLNNIASDCSTYTITEETDCIECTITSLYGVPSVSVVDPATGLVVYDLITIILVQ